MIELFNGLISGLGAVVGGILSILPSSPFTFVSNIDNSVLTALNWIIPISSIVAHLELYLLAVIVYYGLRIVLRWVKVVGD